MATAEDKGQLKKLMDSTPGYKSWVTRSISAGEAAIERVMSRPTPTAVSSLETAIGDVQNRFKKLEDHFSKIMELDPKMTDDIFDESVQLQPQRRRRSAADPRRLLPLPASNHVLHLRSS